MTNVDATKLNLFTPQPMDKVIIADTLTWSVAAATLSGGIYLPKTDSTSIPNPYGAKALVTAAWSIDGVNFYPQKPWIYQPGNPPDEGVGATAGLTITDSLIYFWFTHYLGVTVNFTVKYVLDTIT